MCKCQDRTLIEADSDITTSRCTDPERRILRCADNIHMLQKASDRKLERGYCMCSGACTSPWSQWTGTRVSEGSSPSLGRYPSLSSVLSSLCMCMYIHVMRGRILNSNICRSFSSSTVIPRAQSAVLFQDASPLTTTILRVYIAKIGLAAQDRAFRSLSCRGPSTKLAS